MSKKVDRWVLPDGIEEVLPEQALVTERLRRLCVDLFLSWGYDYVIPPMVEFIDSLLTGSGQDIDLLTFKLTDQLSGKMMGIRADITPQTARMDAHSLKREGVNRLCYAGHVMHTRPKSLLGSRAPILLGVELFGESSLDADIEVMSLLLESLSVAGLQQQYIDIGHVGVYRSLAAAAKLSEEQETAFFELLQAKALVDIQQWVEQHVESAQCRDWLLALPRFAGSSTMLSHARAFFEHAPPDVLAALDELDYVNGVLNQRYPEAQLYFDLGEVRGYHYHTGLVFGAFAAGIGNSIASGGRYDHIGASFGNARPATGFSIDLSALANLEAIQLSPGNVSKAAIFAPSSSDAALWQAIQVLRGQGERVVVGLAGQSQPWDHQRCDRQLVLTNGEYQIEAIATVV